MLSITSIKNPKIKLIQSLEKSRDRKKEGLFVIEGIREISLAQQAGIEFESYFVCGESYTPSKEYPIAIDDKKAFDLTTEVFAKIAYRESTGGIIVLAKMKSFKLEAIEVKPNGLYIILEKVEKPGNIGAILRTADAAGLSGVIVCDEATDFFNPNVIRSSLGCIFTVPICSASNQEVLKWLDSNKIKSYAASLQATSNYVDFSYKEATAFLMGSESEGLSEFWESNANHQIIIPMNGKIDSMNVSNAAAILLFEAKRQRNFQ